MTTAAFPLATMLDVPNTALGSVHHVRSYAGAVYVYSVAGTSDVAVLERSPNYMGTKLDVWCWYSGYPQRKSSLWPSARDTWGIDEDLDHDLERHEFRVPDRYVALSELLLNDGAEFRRLNERVFNKMWCAIEDVADLASGARSDLADAVGAPWVLGRFRTHDDPEGKPVFMRDCP